MSILYGHPIIILDFSANKEWFAYFSSLSLCSLYISYDEDFFKDFYVGLSPIVIFGFSTNLILREQSFTFSRYDVVNLLSLPNVRESSLPIIPYEYKNLIAHHLHFEYSLVTDRNIPEMEN